MKTLTEPEGRMQFVTWPDLSGERIKLSKDTIKLTDTTFRSSDLATNQSTCPQLPPPTTSLSPKELRTQTLRRAPKEHVARGAAVAGNL